MLIQCRIQLNLIHETQASQGRIYTSSGVLVSCSLSPKVRSGVINKFTLAILMNWPYNDIQCQYKQTECSILAGINTQ